MERSSPTRAERLAATMVCLLPAVLVVPALATPLPHDSHGLDVAAGPAASASGPVASASASPGPEVRTESRQYQPAALRGAPYHNTGNLIPDPRLIDVPDSPVRLALWEERADDGGGVVPFYAISLDGRRIARVRQTAYEIRLKAGDFDPLRGVPDVAPPLAADAENRLFIVQFWMTWSCAGP